MHLESRYDEDEEDGPGDDFRSSSDSEDAFNEYEDNDVIEIRTPSRRSSNSSSDGTLRESLRSQTALPQFDNQAQPQIQEIISPAEQTQSQSPDEIDEQRPSFRERHSQVASRSGRGRGSAKLARSSRSKSGSTSASSSSRSRSTQPSDREHVTIAPIAPTILKAGGSTSSEDNTPYMDYRTFGASGGRWRSGTAGDGRIFDAFDALELGAEPIEYGLQHSIMSAYPWLNRDARVIDFDDSHITEADLLAGANNKQSDNNMGQTEVVGAVSRRHNNETFNLPLRYDPVESSEPPGFVSDTTPSVHPHTSILSADKTLSPSHIDYIPGEVPTDGDQDTRNSPEFEDMACLEYAPPRNPRVTSLRAESSYLPATPTSSGAEQPTVFFLAPSLAIPTPGISPAHACDFASNCRSVSPSSASGYLSPQDASPGRGRSPCPSPVSGYLTTGSATSSSGLFSDSRSVSESRSDSRGRSGTRGSSVSVSDQEPERGRSRSRSSAGASGANSPLSDSNSPSTRKPSAGACIGGRCGHSGREIRDGKGVGLYRKTSEDNLKRSGSRGRDRDHRRISESLSPPVTSSSVDETQYPIRDNSQPKSRRPAGVPSQPIRHDHRVSSTPHQRPSTYVTPPISLYSSRTIPPSIPEEDEHRHRSIPAASYVPVEGARVGIDMRHFNIDGAGNNTSCGNSTGVTSSSFAGKAAGIVSSARGLIGSIWNVNA